MRMGISFQNTPEHSKQHYSTNELHSKQQVTMFLRLINGIMPCSEERQVLMKVCLRWSLLCQRTSRMKPARENLVCTSAIRKNILTPRDLISHLILVKVKRILILIT